MNCTDVLDLVLLVPLVFLFEECVAPRSAHLFSPGDIFKPQPRQPFNIAAPLQLNLVPSAIVQDKGGANVRVFSPTEIHINVLDAEDPAAARDGCS